MTKKYKAPRRLKVKPPKSIPHGKEYNRKRERQHKHSFEYVSDGRNNLPEFECKCGKTCSLEELKE